MSNLTLKKIIFKSILTKNYLTNYYVTPQYAFIHTSNTLSIRNNREKVIDNGDIQDVSRLPKSLSDKIRGVPATPIRYVYSFTKRSLESDHLAYKLSGKASGVDAGHCWPTEKQLDTMIADEKENEMDLYDMMDQLNLKKKAKRAKRDAK